MRAETQRRIIAVGTAATFARLSRHVEPYYPKVTAIPPSWMTTIIALAILVLCFKLADMIPDSGWPTHIRPVTVGQVAVAQIVLIWVAVFLGLSGAAH